MLLELLCPAGLIGTPPSYIKGQDMRYKSSTDMMRNYKYFSYNKTKQQNERDNIFKAVNVTQYHSSFVNSYQIKIFKGNSLFRMKPSFIQ